MKQWKYGIWCKAMLGLSVDLKVCLETILFREPNDDYHGGKHNSHGKVENAWWQIKRSDDHNWKGYLCLFFRNLTCKDPPGCPLLLASHRVAADEINLRLMMTIIMMNTTITMKAIFMMMIIIMMTIVMMMTIMIMMTMITMNMPEDKEAGHHSLDFPGWRHDSRTCSLKYFYNK